MECTKKTDELEKHQAGPTQNLMFSPRLNAMKFWAVSCVNTE
jgi:hypothetical protein